MEIKYKIDKNMLVLYEILVLFEYYVFKDKKTNELIKDLKEHLCKKMYLDKTFEKDIIDTYLYHVFELEE